MTELDFIKARLTTVVEENKYKIRNEFANSVREGNKFLQKLIEDEINRVQPRDSDQTG